MPTPLHIVLDIDGVLADFTGGLLPHVSAAIGREIVEADITEYYFEHALGIEPATWAAIWERHAGRLYAEALPYPGVPAGLQALGALGRLSIHTGRPPSSAPATRTWVANHLRMPLEVKFLAGAAKYTPPDSVDYFIEDNLDDVLAASAGHPLLMDRPWNRNATPPHVRRVHNLLEAAAIIEADQRVRPR